jgi:hypothetical protein
MERKYLLLLLNLSDPMKSRKALRQEFGKATQRRSSLCWNEEG